MKKVKDNFSVQSGAYKKFRPTYPQALYDMLVSICPVRDTCWDCGTGNGQVAVALSDYFKKVYATDISENQIAYAPKKENLVYKVERAEATHFSNDQFDLITVAQAVHWFDIPAFNKEVKRVSKNGGVLAIWGYGLLQIEATIDRLIYRFYVDIVGPYWDIERKIIEDGYRNIPFGFKEINVNQQFQIATKWTLDQLEGYLTSWSSVQKYILDKKENPVPWIIQRLTPYWKHNESKIVRFPIFMRVGVIEK
ncbi:MAG: class I SAM-dependent methyltransferase [Maribacter sp.]|nr:class I SAM-dependent methyltransferase [Maribacter sp.]